MGTRQTFGAADKHPKHDARNMAAVRSGARASHHSFCLKMGSPSGELTPPAAFFMARSGYTWLLKSNKWHRYGEHISPDVAYSMHHSGAKQKPTRSRIRIMSIQPLPSHLEQAQDAPIACHVAIPLPVPLCEARIAAWVFPPHNVSELLPSMWLVCFPGSTYTGLGYFDRQVPGFAPFAYSMARSLRGQGIGCIVVDHLGTGSSRLEVDGTTLTRTVLVDAYRHLIELLRHRLMIGTLADGIAPIADERLLLVGVGHSLGGLLLTQLQGKYASLDALAVLGYAHLNETVAIAGVDLQAGLALAEEVAKTYQGYLTPLEARQSLQEFFYSPDVPQALRVADAADGTIFPMGLVDTMQPGIVAEQAARITCPVFLSFGEACDFTMTPRRECEAYPKASSITLLLVAGGAHCTNFAAGRFALWQHLALWCRAQAVQTRSVTTVSV
jgi:pimeloyl-ACP methyl ester carboxylesterase